MKSRKEPYCPVCNDMVEYTEGIELHQGNIKGNTYQYMRRVGRCDICNTELDLFNDENIKILYDVYRDANNLIPLDKIREIPIMYGIGKRTLSIMLGWGEHTLTRYYDGYLPTKPYSDILEKLYTDPMYYSTILEEHKDVLGTNAYRKSKRALNDVITAGFKGLASISRVASCLLSKKTEMTGLGLQKLLYYTQAFSSVFLSEPLFYNQSEAWVNGPVYRDVFDLYKENKEYIRQYSDEDSLTKEQAAVIDAVVSGFGCYDGEILKEFTHREDPWLEARNGLADDERSNNRISLDSINKYFTRIKNEYQMTAPSDMKYYARKMFEEVCVI